MSDEDVLEGLHRSGVVPVVTLLDAAHAQPVGRALVAGGLPCLELTLRNDQALRALEAAAGVEGLLIGAGTVLDARQARQAVDAGAAFLVSPGLDAGVAETARAAGVPFLPGTATATEVMQARALGLTVVKLFPAATCGGPAAVRALAAPFPALRFMPTGGITPQTLPDYLAISAVLAVGGSWLTPPELLAAGDFPAVTRLAAAAVALVAAHRPQTTPGGAHHD